MIQLDVFGLFIGVLLFQKAFVKCQVPPDLGPVGPTFDTCETLVCPENSNCVDEHGYVSCICIPGKTGVNCTIDDPCMERKTDCPAGSMCFGDCRPNVICEGATGYAHCRGCVAGWTGMHCEEDVDECSDSIDPCLNGGVCQNEPGDFRCRCKTGWTGKICECKKGTACDSEESKKEGSNDGNGAQRISSVAFLFISLLVWLV